MDKAACIRWIFLCAALAATVVAIIYPTDEADGIAAPAGRPVAPRVASDVTPVATPMAKQLTEREWVASDENPFMPRLWKAPPPQPEPARMNTPVVAGEAPPPPPSPLPYTFVGQMSDNGSRVVYLARGDQLLLAHSGDMLEGTYKVLEIGTSHIEFETVTTGLRQSLTIPTQNTP